MKTYFKGIKTVAVIFLSLILFSCQDEQIEPQDSLSIESEQMMLKPGKGKGSNDSRLNFEVFIADKPYQQNGFNSLYTPEGCIPTSNTAQPMVWWHTDCRETIKIVVGTLTLHSPRIEIGNPVENYRLWMNDDNGYLYASELILEFSGKGKSFDQEGFEVVIDQEIMVYEKYKIRGVKHEEEVGMVGIGTMQFTLITE